MNRGPETKSGQRRPSVTRRQLIKTGAAAGGAALGSQAIIGFPTVWAQKYKNVTLRQFGTGVSNQNPIAERRKKDLGITLEMTAMDTDSAVQRAVTQPHSYDIADIEYFSVKKVFPTGVMQSLEVRRIEHFNEIVPIFITGKLTATASPSDQGTAPHKVEFVEGQNSRTFAKHPTGWRR
jgi:putative spermidine/putrescine transport system substrate-binding protein